VDTDSAKTLRNVLIILLLAAAVSFLPGGDEGSNTVGNLLTVIFFGGLAFLAYRLYMENRETLFILDDKMRAVLYGSFAVAALAIVATDRLWDEGGAGALLWFALLAAAVYGLMVVYRAYREY
jgi:hypothetical protein